MSCNHHHSLLGIVVCELAINTPKDDVIYLGKDKVPAFGHDSPHEQVVFPLARTYADSFAKDIRMIPVLRRYHAARQQRVKPTDTGLSPTCCAR